ncbi:putative response regulatory protein [compost metagenome]
MKMIIVDDERIGREGLTDFIDWRGDYGIGIAGTAADGQEGYDLYQSVRPDIVLTDIKMPIMTGIELAERIRAVDKKVRIILLSAYSDFAYAQQALKTRVDDYLLKPIEESDLRSLLDRITAESMEESRREDARQQFLNVLDGSWELCPQLRGYAFRVFLFGKKPERSCSGHGMWLLEYHEGANVGIARYPLGEEAGSSSHMAVEGFESCYAGSRVECPEDIRRSYNEAVLSRYIGNFWELKELEYDLIVRRRMQWNRHDAELQQESVKLADEIRSAMNGFDRTRVEAAAHRTMHYLAQNQGVDPAYIEEFLMRLVTRVAQDFVNYQEMNSSLWELRVSLQGRDRFRTIKPFLTGWLLEWAGKAEETRRQSDTTIVQRVIDIVSQEYDQDINLRLLAERVYLSPNYLGNLFRNATGMYFNDYLAGYRMKKATELLQEGADKVTKVGEAVGIPNTSYFSSLFKKTFGVTPKEYRRTHCKQR